MHKETIMEFILGAAAGWFVTKYWTEIKPAVLDIAARIPWLNRIMK